MKVWMLPLMLLAGCAQQTGWAPVVDPYNDPNAYRIQQDLAECKILAQQAAGDPYGSTAGRALLGGAVGAAAGAAIGAAVGGSPGRGAAIGAATGGIGAGAHTGLSREDLYKHAYSTCMRNRGHRVLNY